MRKQGPERESGGSDAGSHSSLELGTGYFSLKWLSGICCAGAGEVGKQGAYAVRDARSRQWGGLEGPLLRFTSWACEVTETLAGG